MTSDHVKRMRACAPLLPPPGEAVLVEALDEIGRLRGVLEEKAKQYEHLADKFSAGESVDFPPSSYLRWARELRAKIDG